MPQTTADRQRKFRQAKRSENGVSKRLDVWLSLDVASDLGALAARGGLSIQEVLTQLVQQATKPWQEADFEGYMAARESAAKLSLRRATRGRSTQVRGTSMENVVTG